MSEQHRIGRTHIERAFLHYDRLRHKELLDKQAKVSITFTITGYVKSVHFDLAIRRAGHLMQTLL